MIRTNYKTLLVVGLLTAGSGYFCSCTSSKFTNSRSPERNFMTPDDVQDGLKLKKNYPNYSRIIENYQEIYSFKEATAETNADDEESNSTNAKKYYSTLTVGSTAYPVKQKLTKEEYEDLKSYAGTLTGTLGQKKASFEAKLKEIVGEETTGTSTTNKKQKVENLVSAKRSVYYEVQALEDFLKDYQGVVGTTAFSKLTKVKANYGKGVFKPTVYEETNDQGYEFKSSSVLNYFNVDMPYTGVKAAIGYDVDYTNTIYNTVTYIPETYFVKNKSICIEVPSWLNVEVVEMNMSNVKYTKSTKKTMSKILKVDEFGSTSKSKSLSGDKNSKYITYEFTDVKPYSDYENEVGNKGASYTYPHLVFLYKSAKIKGATHKLTGTTAGLYDWYKRLMNTLQNNETSAKNKAEELTKNLSTDEEKMKAIYYWVQDNIRYIAFEDGLAGFIPDNCSNVMLKKYGDCKGMANLMFVMLKSLGFDAHRTWIGTEHLNYDYIKTPGLQVDNHMITAVKHKGKWLFLDGTEKMVPFGEVAYRIQNRQCLIEMGDTFEVARVTKNNFENNKKVLTSKLKLNGLIMEGTVNSVYTGQNRMEIIRSIQDLKTENMENAFYDYISNTNNIVPSNITYSDFNNREQDFILNYNISIKNKVVQGLQSKFINLNYSKIKIKLRDTARKTDLEIGNMYDDKFETSLELGSKAKIKYKPEDINVNNEYYSMVCKYELKNGVLKLTRQLQIKQGFIPVSELKTYNEMSEKFNQFENSYVEISE